VRLFDRHFRMFAPVAALLSLFVLVQAFGMIHTAREANKIDIERSSLALAGAMQGHVDRIAGVASDNGYWDDAATAVYRKVPDLAFIRRAWGDSTGDGTNYDGAYVLDPQFRTIIGMRDGKDDPAPIEPRIGKAIRQLVAKPVELGGGVGGFVRLADGPALIGMAEIIPTSAHPDLLAPASQRYHLLFVKRIDQPFLDRTAQGLMINDLHLSRGGTGEISIPLRDTFGHIISRLAWPATDPGMLALKRVLPGVVLALAAAILLTMLIARQGFRSVNELARQALVDGLSDLPNLRALRLELARRLYDQEDVALCLIDLDGFKFINDNYGHAVGDRLIIACSEMLQGMVGEKGFVARLGGDEFAFVLSGRGAWQNVSRLAVRILEQMGEPFRVDDRTVVIGASIGLTHGAKSEVDAGELLRRADVAMYAAKRAGKMRICEFNDKLDQRQARVHLIETELRQSLAKNDFRLVYQPLFGADDGSVNCVEALLRWTSPTLGDVEPADFIPVAEESGLIDPLGRYILRKACEDALGWDGIRVAVNVSAAQLRNPDFANHVQIILDETGFEAKRLELEITETYLITDPATAGQVMRNLQDLGVSIALDDFGTGYASIGFLRQFSFDKLKLDRSLVVDAENSDAARALLQASVAMARALDMEVAAEGVETTGQADLMRVAGCDQLQGWLFDKAMPRADLERMMAARRERQMAETRA
jgi:diguanylate cyclase (GGDEF)-like protein